MKRFSLSRGHAGFTLIELMIVVVIVGILLGIAVPNYRDYIVKASREAAKTELLQLANLQEKIFLNSNNYGFSVTSAYTGQSTGGLGRTSGKTEDGKYDIVLYASDTGTTLMTAVGQYYRLAAVPVAGSTQASDGTITISSDGRKVRGTGSW
ncbi:MAG: prepilin-type N-terminal cleavage/methylation domain-containing protein [Rhodocyclales bacterium]|nr:prepilin-type N-terminal cleavage/methylation domain-containing protein [Rhodocyclales bacterium]